MEQWTHNHMMASWNGNAFCITGPLWGEFTSQQWLPFTMGQWCRALIHVVPLMLVWYKCWTNSPVASNLRHHDTHVTNMTHTCTHTHIYIYTNIWTLVFKGFKALANTNGLHLKDLIPLWMHWSYTSCMNPPICYNSYVGIWFSMPP